MLLLEGLNVLGSHRQDPLGPLLLEFSNNLVTEVTRPCNTNLQNKVSKLESLFAALFLRRFIFYFLVKHPLYRKTASTP